MTQHADLIAIPQTEYAQLTAELQQLRRQVAGAQSACEEALRLASPLGVGKTVSSPILAKVVLAWLAPSSSRRHIALDLDMSGFGVAPGTHRVPGDGV